MSSAVEQGSIFNSYLAGLYNFDLRLVHPKDRVDLLYGDKIIDNGLIVKIDINNLSSYNGEFLTSLVTHPSAITQTLSLTDASLTLVDNRRFASFSSTTLNYGSGDTFFQLYPVSGDRRVYHWEESTDRGGTYIDLYGSYFQGNYKLEGYHRQLLPSTFERGWTLDFWVKFRYCEDEACTPHYECNANPNPDCWLWGETGRTFSVLSGVTFGRSAWDCQEECIPWTWGDKDYSFKELDQIGFNYGEGIKECIDNQGFIFFWGTRAEDKFYNFNISESGKISSEGAPLQVPPYSGTVDLTEYINSMYPYTGVTESRNEGVKWDLVNRITGITNNAFGIKLTRDGRLGYRKVVGHVCEYGYDIPKIEERYSKFPIYRGSSESDWVNISVVYTGPSLTEQLAGTGCTITPDNDFGTLDFYVQGKNVLSVSEFDNPFYEGLDIDRSLQIGVPYTISLGGGSQGLFENLSVDDIPDANDYRLLVERWFNGSFDGGISTFNMYNRPLGLDEIRFNFNKTKSRYGVTDGFGGRVYRTS